MSKERERLAYENATWDEVKASLRMLSGNFPGGDYLRDMAPYHSFRNDTLFARAILLIMERLEKLGVSES